jgi:hypothetical protein
MLAIYFAPSPAVPATFLPLLLRQYHRLSMRCSNSCFKDNAIVQPVFETEFFAPEHFLTLKNILNYPGNKSAYSVC